MSNKNKTQRKNAILGALVADAASLGLHWLYDQKRILAIAPAEPEFINPSPENYGGVPGYYAHGSKVAGDLSHYGEQALVLLRSLVATGSRYDKTHYEDLFREHFGYGGEYVGYIDHPMRDTLDNLSRTEHEALKRSEAIPFDGDENTKHRMITKVLSNIKQASGTKLREKVEQAVRQTHDDNLMVAYAFKLVDELESISGYHGADDEQMPAISKLPALIAAYVGDDALLEATESAVRVTNNNDRAVSFGRTAASIIEAAIILDDVPTAIIAARKTADPEVGILIDQALELKNKLTPEVTSKFGMSCNLAFGVPSVVHNLSRLSSYTEAIRQNIYAGGDSSGRAILLGAVLGSVHGVGDENGIPESWIDKLTHKEEIIQLIEKLIK